jgi:hypothetical protein
MISHPLQIAIHAFSLAIFEDASIVPTRTFRHDFFPIKNVDDKAPTKPLITINISVFTFPVTTMYAVSITINPIKATIRITIPHTNRSEGDT